jgi:DNA-binding transcriptional LysR family regulator
MNLRQLEILEAVAQTGTFTGAAKKLYLTQSAVSHAAAELEHQAGTSLFDRLPRGVRLTPSGELLLTEAKGILGACRELEHRMGNLTELAPVSLVSSITIASFWLPQVLRRLQTQMPGLTVQVQVASAAAAIRILQDGDADLALIEGNGPQGIFSSTPFGSYQLWAACSFDFPLPKPALTPQELCSLPLLLREPGSAIRDTLDSTLYLAHQTARPLWESVNSNALIEAAKAGLGVTVLPDLLLADLISQKQLLRIELKGMPMENKMLAVRRRDKYLTPGLNALLDAMNAEKNDEPIKK